MRIVPLCELLTKSATGYMRHMLNRPRKGDKVTVRYEYDLTAERPRAWVAIETATTIRRRRRSEVPLTDDTSIEEIKAAVHEAVELAVKEKNEA